MRLEAKPRKDARPAGGAPGSAPADGESKGEGDVEDEGDVEELLRSLAGGLMDGRSRGVVDAEDFDIVAEAMYQGVRDVESRAAHRTRASVLDPDIATMLTQLSLVCSRDPERQMNPDAVYALYAMRRAEAEQESLWRSAVGDIAGGGTAAEMDAAAWAHFVDVGGPDDPEVSFVC